MYNIHGGNTLINILMEISTRFTFWFLVAFGGGCVNGLNRKAGKILIISGIGFMAISLGYILFFTNALNDSSISWGWEDLGGFLGGAIAPLAWGMGTDYTEK